MSGVAMTDDLAAAIAASPLQPAAKQEAVRLALEIATDIAGEQTGGIGDSGFVELLLELFRILLPLLLEILKPE